ncbi:hypothetical protein HHI36_003804 [Cryptolaemus montrouzieri]|uniref:Endonuclease/exonuclease/phosphatase domain-containing protein n=1 Tax=Cryptolaemus montrouzieri TaxID=559131 RepID=A0ABD2NQD2_9CUCU
MSSFKISNYESVSYSCRQTYRGGGSLILIREDIDFELNSKFEDEECIEICSSLIKPQNIHGRLQIPSGSFYVFLGRMEDALQKVNMNRGVIIAGDYNVPFGTSESETVRLCDLMESYGFQPVVKNNTRRDACLDNIFLNFEIDSATIEGRDFNISDHDEQLINIPVTRTSKSTPNTKSTFRPVTERDLWHLITSLSRIHRVSLMRIMLVLKTSSVLSRLCWWRYACRHILRGLIVIKRDPILHAGSAMSFEK